MCPVSGLVITRKGAALTLEAYIAVVFRSTATPLVLSFGELKNLLSHSAFYIFFNV